MSALPSDAPIIAARPVLHPGSHRHPPEDLFERVYAAVLSRGAGADLDDLRARVERFRRNVEAIADDAERRRWSALADGIEGAIDAIEAGRPLRADRHLRRGLGAFIADR